MKYVVSMYLLGYKDFFSSFILIVLNFPFQVTQKITSAKKCQRDTMILLFTSAITSAFAECRRELERLENGDLSGQVY